jgi:hypothetical protein
MTGGARPFRERVLELHRALDTEATPHAFGGALALAYYVIHPRATDDIDVNIAVATSEARRVFEALPVGIRWGSRLLKMAEVQGAVRLHWSGGVVVDLFFPTREYDRLVQQRAELYPFADTRLPFVSATDLAILKATFDRGTDVAGKERDWTDLRLMLEAGTPDIDDVLQWIERLQGRESPNLAKLRTLVSEIGVQTGRGPRLRGPGG